MDHPHLNKNALPIAGLLVIHNRKLLLAYSGNKKAWYLPGGKCDGGEAPTEALIREIKEELNLDLDEESLQFYTHITAPAFGETEPYIMEQDCFFYKLKEKPVAGSEIENIRFFRTTDYFSELVPVIGVIMVMEKLKEDGWID